MDIRHVNPFIESFTTVMPQLGFSNIQRGNLSVKGQELTYSEVITTVGIMGAIKDNVVYCIGMEAAKKIAPTMMMGMPVDTLDEMSRSALSELTNILTANAATSFFNAGITIDTSTPTLLYGESISVKIGSNRVLCIQLLVDEYPIEINITSEN